MSIATLSHASLWESDNWALGGTLNGSIGYDSNLTLSNDGPADYVVIANPVLTLSRRNSTTDFRIKGDATHSEFINGQQPAQTDYSFDAIYAYPNGSNLIPTYSAEASWIRTSQPNQYLGERVQNELLNLKAEGYFPLTGKLGIRGSTDYNTSNFASTQLNNASRVDGHIGLAYQKVAATEFSLNFSVASAHSEPNDPANVSADVHSREYYVTTRLQGELTAKISGSVYVGYGRVNYRGGYTHRDDFPVGGADLTWGLDTRRTLVLAAYQGASYAPDGQAVKITRAFLSFTHVVAGQWQYIIRGGPSHSVYSRVEQLRTDNSWDFGTEFAYRPSDRFRVSLAFNYTTQDSTFAATHYQRKAVTLGASYRF